jgi:hypothetical protein
MRTSNRGKSSIRGKSTLAALAVATAAALLSAPAARADFTSPTLASGSPTIESDYGAFPVISANGEYVAFVGSQLGTQGIWRKNLHTGELDLVAGGDANAPSISADGRYISFTTTATDPSTGSGSQCASVYVRDMGPEGTPPSPAPPASAFTLASAHDGSASSIQFAAGCPNGGASAAPRVAISADGNEVAFTVDGASDLMTPGTVATPPAQVAVRYMSSERTVLVSQTIASLGSAPQPVPSGAALTDGSLGQDVAGLHHFADPDSTAAISADGSTVAWQGIDITDQAPAATADAPPFHPFDYSEPLWRRIADGPAAPVRRVTGGDDPAGPCPGGCAGPLDMFWENPGAGNQPNQDTGPSFGTLFTGGVLPATPAIGTNPGVPLDDATPQLSANGQEVAILSTQPSSGQDPACGVNGCGGAPQTTNAFIVNMAPGLSRTAALTRLTQWASNNFGSAISLNGDIDDLAISPEGDRVAFTTSRTVFPYSPPALATPQLPPVSTEQLYVADLADGTLQVATVGYDGQPANGNVLSPSFSANNGPIAYASQATNLVYGALSDQRGGFEVFTVTEVKPPAVPGTTQISPLPANPPITADWRISATARRAPDGAILISVSVPSAGRVSAQARTGIPVSRLRALRRHVHGGARRAQARVARAIAQGRGQLATVTLASAVTGARGAGIVDLRLWPAAGDAPLITRDHGLYATVTVTFAVVGHPPLLVTLPVDFRLTLHNRRDARRPARKASHAGRGSRR